MRSHRASSGVLRRFWRFARHLAYGRGREGRNIGHQPLLMVRSLNSESAGVDFRPNFLSPQSHSAQLQHPRSRKCWAFVPRSLLCNGKCRISMMPGQMKKRALPAASGRNHQHIGVCPLKISDARPDSKGSTDLIDMFLSSINRALRRLQSKLEISVRSFQTV
jgi:hypothetical protein